MFDCRHSLCTCLSNPKTVPSFVFLYASFHQHPILVEFIPSQLSMGAYLSLTQMMFQEITNDTSRCALPTYHIYRFSDFISLQNPSATDHANNSNSQNNMDHIHVALPVECTKNITLINKSKASANNCILINNK